MEGRYQLVSTFICPMNFIGEFVKPNLEYPIRLCVLDTEENFVIDIEHELKYKFIKTNGEYSLCIGEKAKIEENKRFGLFKIIYLEIPRESIEKAEKIIEKLKNGLTYPNGNDILTNEEYFTLINSTKNKEMSNKKVQKMIKRKKN